MSAAAGQLDFFGARGSWVAGLVGVAGGVARMPTGRANFPEIKINIG